MVGENDCLMEQPTSRLEHIAATLPHVMPSLDEGDLIPWLRLHELTGTTPDVAALKRFASQYLDDGHLDAALYAYQLAGISPDPDRLLCFARNYEATDPNQSNRALYLATAIIGRQPRHKLHWYARLLGSPQD